MHDETGKLRALVVGVLLVLSATTAFSGLAAAETITVGNEASADYSSIQSAVDAASSGDRITVENGTYAEDVTVDVGVALKGPNAGIAEDGDDASRNAEATIEGQVVITASGTDFDGFEVTPPPATSNAEAEAVRISGSADDVVVRNSIVRDFGADGIPEWEGIDGIVAFGGEAGDAVTNVTIKDNLVKNLTGRHTKGGVTGISVQGNVDDAEVEENTVTEVGANETQWAFGLVVRGTGNHDVDPASVTLNDNDVFDIYSKPSSDTVGVGLGIESDASVVTARENQIYDAELLIQNKDTTHYVDARYNWWGDANGPNSTLNPLETSSGDVANTGPIRIAPWYDAPEDQDWEPTAPVVHDRYGIYNLTIEEGIAVASPGESVRVLRGPYRQPINVTNPHDGNNRNISIVADGDVEIEPTQMQPWNPPSEPKSNRKTAVRVANVQNITFEGFTFDFGQVKDPNEKFAGMLYWNSTGALLNNHIGNTSTSGFYEQTTIFQAEGYTHDNRAQVVVENNTYRNTGRQGLATHGYVDAHVQNNEFHSADSDAGYAIELGSESTGDIVDNEVHGYADPFNSVSESAGIYVENAFTHDVSEPFRKSVRVAGNEIYDNQIGIQFGQTWDGLSANVVIDATFEDNHVHDNAVAGVHLTDENADAGSAVHVTARNNTVENNGEFGYHVFTEADDSSVGDGNISLAMVGGAVTGHQTGILVQEGGDSADSSIDVSINRSNLSANDVGVNNTWTDVVDARYNWWGDADGPNTTENPLQTNGSAISGDGPVSYVPWLDAPADAGGQATAPARNVDAGRYNLTVQRAVDAASDGQTIELGAGEYAGATIDTAVTIRGAGTGATTLRGGHSVVTLQSPNVSLADLSIANGDNRGIHVPTTVDASGLTLRNVVIRNNSDFGMYVAGDTIHSDAPDNGAFDDVLLRNVSVRNHDRKGLYIEKLSNAIFDNLVVDGVTSDTYGYNDGIDINLKDGDYENVTIRNSRVSNVSAGSPSDPSFAAAVAIKARDDGSYVGSPATLSDVTVESLVVRDSFNGLRFGEPGANYSVATGPSDVSVTNSRFVNNTRYHFADVPGTVGVEAVHDANTFEKAVGVERADGTNGPTIWAQIRAAVDQARANDTVHVGPGSYRENVTLGTPNVRLTGNGTIAGHVELSAEGTRVHGLTIETPTFTPDALTAAGVLVKANDTAVEATRIRASGDAAAADGSFSVHGIQVFGGGATVSNVTIRGNEIDAVANAGSSGWPNHGGSVGVKVQGTVANVSVAQNRIENVSSAGWSYGVSVTPSGNAESVSPRDVDVTGNTVKNVRAVEYDGVALGIDTLSGAVGGDYPTNASQVEVHRNDFVDTDVGVLNKDTGHELDATLNWWGAANGPGGVGSGDGANVSDNVRYAPWLDAPAANGGQPTAAVRNQRSGTYHPTFQHGIERALPGDTLLAQSGTYHGSINVTDVENVTVLADGTVELEPTSMITWDVGSSSQQSRETPIRVVDSEDLAFDGITFDFGQVKDPNEEFAGILYWNSTGALRNNRIGNTSTAGVHEQTTIFQAEGYTHDDRASVIVENNSYRNTGRQGLVTHGYVDATVRNNEFHSVDNDSGYAIELGSESTGDIIGNEIHGYADPFNDVSESAGIYVENAFTTDVSRPFTKAVRVSNNEIYDNQVGLQIGQTWKGRSANVTIDAAVEDNHVHDNSLAGIQVTHENAGTGSAVTVDASGNLLVNNSQVGYHVFTEADDSSLGDGNVTLTVAGDTIRDHWTGVLVDDGGTVADRTIDVSINESDLSDNDLGVNNTISEPVDARYNYWGAPSGPSVAFGGFGSSAAGNVNATPFYVDASLTVLSKATGTASVRSNGSASVDVGGEDVNRTEVTLPSGSNATSVAVVETDGPAGGAPEPDQDVSTHLDVSADTAVEEPTEITVRAKVSALRRDGIIPPTQAALIHYENGNWTELDTDVTIRGGTAILNARTQHGLSPFAIGEETKTEPNDGGSGGGGGVLAEERTVTERLATGPTRTVTIDFEDPTSGSVDIEPVEGLPASADPAGTVVAVVDVTVPNQATDRSATLELAMDRVAIDSADADPSDLRIVHYDGGELRPLETTVKSATGSTVSLAADVSSFSRFAVIVSEDAGGSTTPTAAVPSTPAATPTPTPANPGSERPRAERSQEPTGDSEVVDRGTPTPASEPGGFGLAGLAGTIALVILSVAGVALYRRRLQ
jgi:PGF-pre-PGF domain-containing protein